MSNLSDVVGGADMYNGNSYSYSFDRFCSPNAAIALNNGYLQVPSGVYFSGDFSLTVWFNYNYFGNLNIIDFSNGFELDNLAFKVASNYIAAEIYQGDYVDRLNAYTYIQSNTWNHLALVLNGYNGYIYLNGIQVANKQLLIRLNNVNRTSNYVGRSSMNDFSFSYAMLDDLKIHKGALTSNEILNDYTISSLNGKFF